MVSFTRVPKDYAASGENLRYTFVADKAATYLLRITDARTDTVVSAVRFVDVSRATFDIAPIVRRMVKALPANGGTGLRSADSRTVEVVVALWDAEGVEVLAETLPKTFVVSALPVKSPSILTTMPAVRMLSLGECEELLLLSDAGQTVTVEAEGVMAIEGREFAVTAKPSILRIDSNDFAGAESVTVDCGACGTVTYCMMPTHAEGVRLAWLSSCGSVEHYTFPVVREREVVTEGGAVRERWCAVSAYESEAVVEALAEMLSSPEVWIAERNLYTAVEMVTRRCVVRRAGAVSLLEVEFLTAERRRAWN